MNKKIDFASLTLALISVVTLFTNHFMFKSSARIGEKIGITAIDSLGKNFAIVLIMTILLIGLILLKRSNEKLNLLTVMSASICSIVLVTIFGYVAKNTVFEEGINRISVSIGGYLYLIMMFLIQIKCAEYIKNKTLYRAFVMIPFVAIFVECYLGWLNGLSILVEYNNRAEQFNTELFNHIYMSLMVVITGTIIGVPLGWFSYKNKKASGIIFGILNTLESIPALALICVMMFPLSFISNHVEVLRNMGVSGVGATPVFIALLCYSLFQIVNSMYGALSVIDKKYLEVARGMGMTTKQIFFKIEIPMILPVLISGIRVSLINTILGVTIGAYVGFGGLGMFILQGVTGFAVDIVLLVTIPIMFIIFISDFILKEIEVLLGKIRIYRGRVKL